MYTKSHKFINRQIPKANCGGCNKSKLCCWFCSYNPATDAVNEYREWPHSNSAYRSADSAVVLYRVSYDFKSDFQDTVATFDILSNAFHLSSPNSGFIWGGELHPTHQMLPMMVPTIANEVSTYSSMAWILVKDKKGYCSPFLWTTPFFKCKLYAWFVKRGLLATSEIKWSCLAIVMSLYEPGKPPEQAIILLVWSHVIE